MTSCRPAPRPPGVRTRTGRTTRGTWALSALVTVLLGGLLAMHGLGPAPVPTHKPPSAAAQTPEAHHASGHARGHDCGHHAAAARGLDARHPAPAHGNGQRTAEDGRGHGGSGHVTHADSTCAAGGTSGGPVMAMPAASTPAGAQPSAATAEHARAAAAGERAPPSLHQLQLLRI
ncbi:MAG TPA: DUF6153 family protein [Streptomyces sp.]|nr:DUF6153 family protein [Streptomyces sp.]